MRRDFEKLELEVVPRVEGGLLAAIVVQSSLIDEIKASQLQDPNFRKVVATVRGLNLVFRIKFYSTLTDYLFPIF